MTTDNFPKLDPEFINGTRDALHAYSRILGGWASSCRPKRKHWWHASLRPSLNGLTTGIIRAGIDFELELDLGRDLLLGRTPLDEHLVESLQGKSPAQLEASVRNFLVDVGIDSRFVPEQNDALAKRVNDYSAEQAFKLGCALNLITGAMESFRASIREETSPVQLWPHHFDLAMLWLSGAKIPDQDPANEEYADQQMNFGFTFGDEGIPEPYFYVTAYPSPEAFSDLRLPSGTTWQSEGFTGAVLPYRLLIENADPGGYLLDLWNGLLRAGREHLPALAA